MEKTEYQEINSMNGCGVDDTSRRFYEKNKRVSPTQEDQEELEDLIDSVYFS